MKDNTMEIQFEVSKIDSYSKALAEKLCNEFFGTGGAITGVEILKFTPIEQVNIFVLKTLFDRWNDESSKLKSPYFNYENIEVKESLQHLLNKLSQNIYIKRDFFQPLLEKAIFNTLWLILKPESFFAEEYSRTTEIKLSDIKNHEKYYRINKNVVQHLIRTLEWEKKEIVPRAEVVNLTNKLIHENPLGSFEKEQLLNSFNSILKFESNSEISIPETIEEKKVIVKEVPQPIFVEEPKIIKPIVVEEPKTVKPIVVEEPKTVKSMGAEETQHATTRSTENTILNEKFLGVQLTVNDLLKSPSSTLADKIGRTRIENIKSAISLSQKFMFINALFKGAGNEYESMLTDIDLCTSYHQAMAILNDKYASKYNWDFTQYEVKEFIEIVERKFS
jgi:hypothetical protein